MNNEKIETLAPTEYLTGKAGQYFIDAEKAEAGKTRTKTAVCLAVLEYDANQPYAPISAAKLEANLKLIWGNFYRTPLNEDAYSKFYGLLNAASKGLGYKISIKIQKLGKGVDHAPFQFMFAEVGELEKIDPMAEKEKRDATALANKHKLVNEVLTEAFSARFAVFSLADCAAALQARRPASDLNNEEASDLISSLLLKLTIGQTAKLLANVQARSDKLTNDNEAKELAKREQRSKAKRA